MATAVVSGRVDEDIKRRANAYISEAGKTPAEVILTVWTQIAETGKIPEGKDEGDRERRKRAAFGDLRRIWSEVPEGTPLATMTDAQIKDLLASRSDE